MSLPHRKWLGSQLSQLIKWKLSGRTEGSEKRPCLIKYLITHGYRLTRKEIVVAKKIELLMRYGMDYENPFDWPLDDFLTTDKEVTFKKYFRNSLEQDVRNNWQEINGYRN